MVWKVLFYIKNEVKKYYERIVKIASCAFYGSFCTSENGFLSLALLKRFFSRFFSGLRLSLLDSF